MLVFNITVTIYDLTTLKSFDIISSFLFYKVLFARFFTFFLSSLPSVLKNFLHSLGICFSGKALTDCLQNHQARSCQTHPLLNHLLQIFPYFSFEKYGLIAYFTSYLLPLCIIHMSGLTSLHAAYLIMILCVTFVRMVLA